MTDMSIDNNIRRVQVSRVCGALLTPDSALTARLTMQDYVSIGGRTARQGHMHRNKNVVDQRTKDAESRLRSKLHNQRIDEIVARIDVQMQKLLETQDPAKEELYDKFAERREEYLSKRV